MITSTSLKSSAFLAKVVKGCDLALNSTYLNGTDMGMVPVLNAKGTLALIAIFRTGYGMEFLDADDNDVTEAVMSALRELHGYKTFH